MSKVRNISLALGGFVAGALITLQIPALAEKDTKPSLPIEELRTFAEVYNAIKQGYVEPVDDKKMIANAISGLLSNLDPHSAYLDTDAFKDLRAGTQGEFGGLGIEVGMEDGLVKVVSPIEDTPAFRAGLKAGDLIFKLDDTPVKGLTLNDAVKKMRGKPKTPIRISLIRKGENKPIEVTLVREVIKVQSVKSKLVEPGYGWLRITQFQENTGDNMVKHLNDLTKQGPLKGLVLDLRNDPGGLLNGAIGVSAAFLPPNTKVVSTDGRTEDAKQEFLARPADYLRGSKDDYLKSLPASIKTVPMVVLVNSGSASASEIVAGALQDHKRAVIMGTQTFGKGSVQTVLPLPGSAAIKLTTARYYTPSGRSIQAKGIVPDIVVEETPDGAPGTHIREADLERHLINDKDTAAGHDAVKDAAKIDAVKPQPKAPAPAKPKGKDSKDGADEDPLARIEYAGKNDRQFAQALNLLKGMQIMQSKVQ
ncbi:MAG: family peptidase [Rhodocyclaceae bacterium]|nr:family peptidase [Rhodocyclaceae bacterium]